MATLEIVNGDPAATHVDDFAIALLAQQLLLPLPKFSGESSGGKLEIEVWLIPITLFVLLTPRFWELLIGAEKHKLQFLTKTLQVRQSANDKMLVIHQSPSCLQIFPLYLSTVHI